MFYTQISRSFFVLLLVGMFACSGNNGSSSSDNDSSASDVSNPDGSELEDGSELDGGRADTGPLSELGEDCVDNQDCAGNVCLRIASGLEFGFCSNYCFDEEDCGDETWDCIFLRNSGTDAAFLCAPDNLCIDQDQDNYGIGPGCAGSDCNDDNSAVNPSASELCDGLDNDCDSNIDDNPIDTNIECVTDFSGICAAGRFSCLEGGQLQCLSRQIPLIEECDGVDNSCDGHVDENPDGSPLISSCYGGPPETQDVGACSAGIRNCVEGALSSCVGQVLPIPELCDGLDNDCDGTTDEDNPGAGFLCETELLGVCSRGITSCENSVSSCLQQEESSEEICDGLDNDCDGEIDENEDGELLSIDCYGGPDGSENIGVCVGGTQTCIDGDFGICDGDIIPGIELCDGLDNNCQGEIDEGDPAGGFNCATGLLGICAQGQTSCDDNTGTSCLQLFFPETEICDGFDNDCDGLVDESNDNEENPLSENCYGGPENTENVGICHGGTRSCMLGQWQTCQEQIIPAIVETCDGFDNDCDGEVDEEVVGVGTACSSGLPGSCSAGTMTCSENGTSCIPTITPGTIEEICDGIDNDCDGIIDNGETWNNLGEMCNEGTGACLNFGVRICNSEDPTGSTICSASANEETAELCDGLDNDCDGEIDENWLTLGDGCVEGIGTCQTVGIHICDPADPVGNTICSASANEESTEICDGLDNDCDGQIDEEFTTGEVCIVGQGECSAIGVSICTDDGLNTECSATEGSPSTETCDGLDNNCDGQIDEGYLTGTVCAVGEGACYVTGTLSCSSDGLSTECSATEGAGSVEECDGIDNDCDGQIDEDFNIGVGCSEGVGQCQELGSYVCNRTNNGTICDATPTDPTSELCDGIDNNCDGQIDEGFSTGTVCSIGEGACYATGTISCSSDGLNTECSATEGSSSAEQCDGIDNDCDGQIDEDFNIGVGCSEGLGQCLALGSYVCNDSNNGTVCDAIPTAPTSEICDGFDNNCNGEIDENFLIGTVCSIGEGACHATGTIGCAGNGTDTVCSAVAGSSSVERCDGIDNDCDGEIDEDFSVGFGCSDGLGECRATGTIACAANGSDTVCSAVAGSPNAELCDELDNDCDGQIDEDFNVGIGCSDGLGECFAFGSYVCNGNNDGTICDAIAGSPNAELCDELDNDCDGQIDEDFNVGVGCSNGLGECFTLGSYVCDNNNNGTVCDATAGSPNEELCDELDNDCDGQIDEDFNVGVGCSEGLGQCFALGSYACNSTNDGVICDATPGSPSNELCDLIDNDCNGVNNNDIPNLGETCFDGQGICRQAGVYICDSTPASPAICDASAIAGNPNETCDYLDDDCDGEIDEDFKDGNGNYNQAENCGGCGVNCNEMWVPSPDTFNVIPFCSTSGCDYACITDFYDLDLDPSNGCEFTPDPLSIYVSTPANSGNDSASCGSYSEPCASIQYGLERAANTSGKERVRVSTGIYRENITLSNGIHVWGGFNPVNWMLNAAVNVTTIAGQSLSEQDAITVTARNITNDTDFSGFTIQASNGRNATSTLPAGNSIGIYIIGSDNHLSIEDNTVRAGVGGNGMLGGAGNSGVSGSNGSNGQDRAVRNNCPEDRAGGDGGETTCYDGTDTNGGAGGTSYCPSEETYQGDGIDGQNNNPAPSGENRPADDEGEGGDGGANMYANNRICQTGGREVDPVPGFFGQQGTDASGGNGSTDSDGRIFNGLQWRGASGENGSVGVHGGGGGGGGATAGLNDNYEYQNRNYYGASGGGGGAGGCAGEAGLAGEAGGGSFAILLILDQPSSDAQMPDLLNNHLARGTGGNGGNGGTGGSGGDPGTGGLGGRGVDDGYTFDFCMFDGGLGAQGGRGGHGGGGGGGAGGVSYDLYLWDYNNHTNNYLSNNTFDQNDSVSTGGAGGTGGNSSNTSVGLGDDGVAGDSGNLHSVLVP